MEFFELKGGGVVVVRLWGEREEGESPTRVTCLGIQCTCNTFYWDFSKKTQQNPNQNPNESKPYSDPR